MISIEFLITSLIVVLIPGTSVLFTISTGLAQGRKASVYAALGCTSGIVPHLLATIFGLAAIMHTSALAFEVLKIAGVVYLFYLALMTWRDKSGFETQAISSRSTALSLATKAFLLNILNPKLTIFFLAFLPQFVLPETTSPLGDMVVLSAVFMLMTFVVFVLYGLLAHGFRHRVMDSQRVQTWLKRGFALSFAGLGIELASSTQK
ncbi:MULTISPECIES: LysE family translocator [unclassified Sulfurospirillum]|uniref:LysE family translocator n=1 Tax=unclassified Sulfurospirillum TaxID=2618290 RepID=UPI0004FF92AD|nr:MULTISPECIES: LysE family translocator [unclassified Sulfurospirillum]KFL34956.1 lysine transporter LysE [Sulfurospirillum sp. SCADC]